MTTVITGADGYVGQLLTRVVLQQTSEPVVALLRARDADELESKRSRLLQRLEPFADRVECRVARLPDASDLLEIDTKSVRLVLHAAAITEFGVSREQARAVNVDGTRAVLELARRCPRLERVVLLSTVYSSGLRAGEIAERIYGDDAGFANHYEWSKWAAEALLEREFGDLPWQVQRLATVLCEDEGGRVVQLNVLHKMWRLLHAGLLPLVAGSPLTPLYFVSGGYLATVCPKLWSSGGSRSVFHLCNSGSDAISAGRLLDLAHAAFGRDAEFARRRVLKPLFTDAQAFERLADAATSFSQGTLGSIVGALRPFAQQMFVTKSLSTDHTTELVEAFRPKWDELVPAVCEHLVSTGFGLAA
jgi:nucleoside-diphosphate-sugar epimerase